MVVVDDGLGSGCILGSDSEVLTNWHVIRGSKTVGVIYKPDVEGAKITRADVRRARVMRVDEIADLALLRVDNPKEGVPPLTLGSMQDVAVGADVHAIGHPTGENWTYTKGVISQIRRDYAWTSDRVDHTADVIQTQTPINPGNSGGPLLDDSGALIGVNSFKTTGTEGLNFAVAVDEINRFLASRGDRLAGGSSSPSSPSPQEQCKVKVLGVDRMVDPPAKRTFLDLDCDGKPEAIVIEPDSKKEPMYILVDVSKNGKFDGMLISTHRNGKIDYSLWDVDGDGKPDLIGHHPDGSWAPSSYEKYQGSG
jgi:hypothetical protein